MSEATVTEPERSRSTLVRRADQGPPRDGGWSDRALHQGSTRYRISILAFEGAGILRRAAQELRLHGFNSAQFCLFGRPQMFAALVSFSLSDDDRTRELESLLKAPSVVVRLADTSMFEMRCGRFAGSLFTPVDAGLVEASWMRAELARGIAADIANDCVVLLVTSATADQHALGAKLLLRHGNRDLLTHEFTVSS